MKIYPSYDSLAIDLDLHFFDKISILSQVGNRLRDGKWFVVTDDGQCHLFDENGDLDNINKLHTLKHHDVNKDIKKIIIPDSVTNINNFAFDNCSGLTSVTIPNSVTCIGDYAFAGCSRIIGVTIGNSIMNIGDWAFTDCSRLTNVMIPDSVTKIGSAAFYNCHSLTSMTIPESIRYIGYAAFAYCKNLKNLFFKGKTLKQIEAMKHYPWGIKNEDVITAELK